MNGEFIKFSFNRREFFFRRCDEAFLRKVIVTNGAFVEVEESQGERVFLSCGSESARDVGRIVCEARVIFAQGAGIDAARVGEKNSSIGIGHEVIPAAFHEMRAALTDSNKGQARVGFGTQERVVEMLREPVYALRDERGVCNADGRRERVDGVEWRAHGMRICKGMRRGRGGSLLFSQSVDRVVEHEDGHFHVVAQRVNPVCGADGATVAVASDDEDVEIGTARTDAAGDGQRASMKAVEAIRAHVMGQARGTADATDDDGLFGREAAVLAELLQASNDGVVAARRAPARCRALIIVE